LVSTTARAEESFTVKVLNAVGWTADEHSLVYRFKRMTSATRDGSGRGEGEVSLSGTFFAVVDVVKGRKTIYREKVDALEDVDANGDIAPGLESLAAASREWNALPSKAQFSAWLAKNKLTTGTEGASCGAASASIQTFPGNQAKVFGVDLEGVVWKHFEFSNTAKPSWSPGCHYLAWILPDGEPGVFPAGPLVDVLAAPRLQAAVEPTLKALAAAGFGATAKAPAQKERPKSVVYTWGGARAAAEKIAALVPGGATVEPLTWVTPSDIVVALGASALK
jgi:hypothetical protein